MPAEPQNFENHGKIVPLYHGVITALVLSALALSLLRVVQEPSVDTALSLILTVALVVTAWFTRAFPLKVQDRVIRLEERLRLERLLPDDLQGRIPSFTTEQLIGLRFASDAELPELARRVLEEGIADRKEIKMLVVNWRPDHERA